MKPIRDDHIRFLQLALKRPLTSDPLPIPVQVRYWDMARAATRMGLPITPHDLMFVAIGYGIPEDDEKTIYQMAEDGEIAFDQELYVSWQRGAFRLGTFKGIASGDTLRIDVGGTERNVVHTRIRLVDGLPDGATIWKEAAKEPVA